MFNAITWENFILTTLLIAGGYYIIATFLLFHKEITSWLKSKPDLSNHAQSTSDNQVSNDEILGITSPEENWLSRRSSIVRSEDVRVSEMSTEEMPDIIQTPGENDLLNGTVADLMEEIKSLLQMMAEENTGKQECAPLFIALFDRYSHLRNTPYALAINRHLCEEAKSTLSFELQPLEVRSWWETSHKD